MVMKTRVSLEEFLAMEETKPYLELIDGEVVAKPMPNDLHGAIVAELIYLLQAYVRRAGGAVVRTEVRHLLRSEERVYLPDIEVRRGVRRPQPGLVESVPELAIEVLSPDTHPGRLAERVDFYMRVGAQLLWVVDPETQTVMVYRPDAAPQLFRRGQAMDARPVLSDFSLDLEALFSVLDEPEGEPSA